MAKGLLRCPSCGHGLIHGRWENLLACEGCGSHYPLFEGIPSFASRENYWGEEFSLEEMREINSMALGKGWREAVREKVAPKSPSRAGYILDGYRADWRFLFPVEKSWRVLDVGAGWGSLSAIFAGLVEEVVPIESAWERARFIQTRVRQDGLPNVSPVHGNLSNPPLPRDYFDLAILNGALEWFGCAETGLSGRKTQALLLRNVCDLIKPEGWIYIGIENRYSASYMLGAPDHNGMRYTSLMPRLLAHAANWMRHGQPYRTYTWSAWGCRNLLHKSGFKDVEVYGVLPSYSRPIYYWPLGEAGPVRELAGILSAEIKDGLNRKQRLAKACIDHSPDRLLGLATSLVAPHFLIRARKRGANHA